jgi:hypothetical protein
MSTVFVLRADVDNFVAAATYVDRLNALHTMIRNASVDLIDSTDTIESRNATGVIVRTPINPISGTPIRISVFLEDLKGSGDGSTPPHALDPIEASAIQNRFLTNAIKLANPDPKDPTDITKFGYKSYRNSILQMLLSMQEFTNAVLRSKDKKNPIPNLNALFKELFHLALTASYNPDQVPYEQKLTDPKLRLDCLSGSLEEDAAIFLSQCIVDRIRDPEILQWIGLYEQVISYTDDTCTTQHRDVHTKIVRPILVVNPIRNDLQECITRYQDCKPIPSSYSTDSTKQMQNQLLNPAGPYCMIQLDRFQIDSDYPTDRNRAKKIKTLVNIVDTIQIGTTPKDYTLKGVIAHIGEEGTPLESGHYIYLKRNNDNTWTKYDDETIETINDAVAVTAVREFLNTNAYLCLYKHADGPDAEIRTILQRTPDELVRHKQEEEDYLTRMKDAFPLTLTTRMTYLIACHCDSSQSYELFMKDGVSLTDVRYKPRVTYVDPSCRRDSPSEFSWNRITPNSKDILWTEGCDIYHILQYGGWLNNQIESDVFVIGHSILKTEGLLMIPFSNLIGSPLKVLQNVQTYVETLPVRWNLYVVKSESYPLYINKKDGVLLDYLLILKK